MSTAFSDDFSNSATHSVLVLNRENLPAIAAQDNITTPSYDLDQRTASTVHFAFGNFAAAHIAVYHDKLLEKGVMNAGIIAVIPRKRTEAALQRREALQKQDFLYSVSERDRTTDQARIIGSLMDIMVGPDNRTAVYQVLANPEIKLVTGTVTQKGYPYNFIKKDEVDDNDKERNDPNKDYQENQFADYIVEGLALRFQKGIAPFAVMSCDNITNNSSQLKNLVVTIASLKGLPGFKEWVANEVPFFDTMVDRITPGITSESRDRIQSHYSVIDEEPITTEPSMELVIGVKNGGVQPPLPYNLVGATYTENPDAHERAKLRMLNGTHLFIGVVGRVAGETYIEEALSNSELLARTKGFMAQVQATLDPIPERNLDDYAENTIERFLNPYPHDMLQRLARTGVDKIDTRFLMPLMITYQRNLLHNEIVAGIANYFAYLSQANDNSSIKEDTENGFFIEDQKAYDQGYVAVAKSLNGDISPIFSLPMLAALVNSDYSETFKREIQEAWTNIVHPEPANGLNASPTGGNNGPSSPTVY